MKEGHEGKMQDRYSTFAHLTAAEREGVDYRVHCADRGSGLLILAPHGGAIEPGTSELAKAVADRDLSFYLFEGIKPSNNRSLHITSANFDEPKALDLVRACDTSIAIHGEGSDPAIVYLGGGDEALRPHVARRLQEAGFETRTHGSPGMQGTSATNICNRCRTGAGLQLELSRGLRRRLFRSLSLDGRRQPTVLFDRFVRAIRAGIGDANVFQPTRVSAIHCKRGKGREWGEEGRSPKKRRATP